MADWMGSWAVSGPALATLLFLGDEIWAIRMTEQLLDHANQFDRPLSAGWHTIGGTSLFRLYQMIDAITGRNIWPDNISGPALSAIMTDGCVLVCLLYPGDRLQQAIIRQRAGQNQHPAVVQYDQPVGQAHHLWFSQKIMY